MSNQKTITISRPLSFSVTASTLKEAIEEIDKQNIRQYMNNIDEPLATDYDIAIHLYNYFPTDAEKMAIELFKSYALDQYKQSDGTYLIEQEWDSKNVKLVMTDDKLQQLVIDIADEYKSKLDDVSSQELYADAKEKISDFLINNEYINEFMYSENHIDPFIFNHPSIWKDNDDIQHALSDWFYANVKTDYKIGMFLMLAYAETINQ